MAAGVAILYITGVAVIIGHEQTTQFAQDDHAEADTQPGDPPSEGIAGAGCIKCFFAAAVEVLKKAGEEKGEKEGEPDCGPADLPVAEGKGCGRGNGRCRRLRPWCVIGSDVVDKLK